MDCRLLDRTEARARFCLGRSGTGAAEAILENVRTGVFHIPLQLAKAAASLQRLFRKYRDRESIVGGANKRFRLLLRN